MFVCSFAWFAIVRGPVSVLTQFHFDIYVYYARMRHHIETTDQTNETTNFIDMIPSSFTSLLSFANVEPLFIAACMLTFGLFRLNDKILRMNLHTLCAHSERVEGIEFWLCFISALSSKIDISRESCYGFNGEGHCALSLLIFRILSTEKTNFRTFFTHKSPLH